MVAVVLFTCVSHRTLHTFELSIPIHVVIWLLEFPVSTATLGIAVAVGYGLDGLGALPGGILADRYGSRQLIVVSGLLGLLLFALQPLYQNSDRRGVAPAV
jgi:MFS family permease